MPKGDGILHSCSWQERTVEPHVLEEDFIYATMSWTYMIALKS
jgi:hypothetical protein